MSEEAFVEKHLYEYTGEGSETFPYLPADPPSRTLEPGDTVECFEPVEHPRLKRIKTKTTGRRTQPQ